MQQLELPGFDVRECAAYVGVRRETVYSWIRDGKVDATLNVNGEYRIPYVEVHRLVREREARVSQ